jgi:hypothetical protein
VDGETLRRNWLGKSPSVARKRRRRTIWRYEEQTKRLTPIVKKTNGYKEAEDEEPMELRRKTS